MHALSPHLSHYCRRGYAATNGASNEPSNKQSNEPSNALAVRRFTAPAIKAKEAPCGASFELTS